MSWTTALKTEVLGERAKAEIEKFALGLIPRFEAPTDVAAWRKRVRRLQRDVPGRIYLRGFPKSIVEGRPKVVWGDVLRPHESYVIRKLRYEIYPDYWIPALLYEPVSLRGKVPVVLNPNGHHSGGKAATYKQARCANLARRGMVALNFEFIGMGELQTDMPHDDAMAPLNLTGMAGYGFMYLAMLKGLDLLLAHKHADPERVVMTGLSGGGWQTIVLSALDPRINVSVPVAGYTGMRTRVKNVEDMGDIEQTPVDLTTVLDYQDMTAMLAPRPALLILNHDDGCFRAGRTRPVIYDAVKPTYRAFGALDSFETHDNMDPGTHNYDEDNRNQLYRFLNRHLEMDTPEHDIHCEDEIFPEHELEVGLPVEQETLRHLAVVRAKSLAAKRRHPRTAAEKRRLRRDVAKVVRLPDWPKRVRTIKRSGTMEVCALRAGGLTVPLVGRVRQGGAAELMVSDWGRNSLRVQLPVPLASSRFVADIFGTGENAYSFRHVAIVESAGLRALGIQVAQILACARFVLARTGEEKLDLMADGDITSVAALVAAGQEPKLFRSLVATGSHISLVPAMQGTMTYTTHLPLFCFGLLEVADLPQLVSLLEGVDYYQPGRCVTVTRG